MGVMGVMVAVVDVEEVEVSVFLTCWEQKFPLFFPGD